MKIEYHQDQMPLGKILTGLLTQMASLRQEPAQEWWSLAWIPPQIMGAMISLITANHVKDYFTTPS